MSLSVRRLKEALSYEEETGVFRWKVAPSRRVKVGDVAGCVTDRGYVAIRLDNNLYWAHRLAWFYIHGVWPHEDIDHINCNKSDNRVNNLRLASRSENMCNTPKRADNTSGLKGVIKSKCCRSWIAQARMKGKNYYLGSFKTKEEAHSVYMSFLKKHRGDFARA